MNYIVDTHIVIDLYNNLQRVSDSSYDIIGNLNNKLYLSYASFWEIAIKTRKGKLSFSIPFAGISKYFAKEYKIIPLPIKLNHFEAISSMPLHHADPFDRLIISQSMATAYPIITADKEFNKYAIKVLN